MSSNGYLAGICTAIRDAWRADSVSLPPGLLRWAIDAARQSPRYLSLPLLTCEATGGDPTHAVPMAAAWHLLHCAGHLLDDVEDQALEPSVPPARVVNWGTTLIFAAQWLLQSVRGELDGERQTALSRAFTAACLRVCVAQDADLAAGPGQEMSLEDYWRVAGAKGSEPFALACRAGAMLGAQSQTEVGIYTRFGYHLGVLLQLGDDLRDVWQPRNRGDLLTAARTLPVVYALSVAPAESGVRLRDLLRRIPGDQQALCDLQSLLADLGALHYLTVQAARQRQLARATLFRAARPGLAQRELLNLLDAAFPALAREPWSSPSGSFPDS